MNRQAVKSVQWTKPEVRRLGEIKDVSGNVGIGTQQGNNKS